MCGINCLGEFNATGCRVENDTCVTEYSPGTVTECHMSLCDCTCYPAGMTPEEQDGRLCGINCYGLFNISGCSLVDDACVVEYVVATPTPAPTATPPPATPTPSLTPPTQDNTILYVAIAAGALVLLALIVGGAIVMLGGIGGAAYVVGKFLGGKPKPPEEPAQEEPNEKKPEEKKPKEGKGGKQKKPPKPPEAGEEAEFEGGA